MQRTITMRQEFWHQGPTDTTPPELVDPQDTTLRYETTMARAFVEPIQKPVKPLKRKRWESQAAFQKRLQKHQHERS